MKSEDTAQSPALGLDIGTSRIVLAKQVGQEFSYESQLNAFISVPFAKMTEKALEKDRIAYTSRGSDIIVHGNESDRFADVLGVEMRRPMTQGLLNPTETESLTVIQKIVESLTGSGGGSRPLNFSVPAPPLGSEQTLTYHETTLREMLSGFGYEVRSVNEGLAVIYAELEGTNYTGFGISCGGGLCNVCLAYLSVPVLSFSIPKAGDFIDTSASSVTGEIATRVRLAKETSFHFNGHFTDKIHQVLNVYYDDMIRALIDTMKQACVSTRSLPKLGRPIPVVLSGGTALPKGFRDRFQKILDQSDFPIAISDVRMAKDPLHTTAKGALAAALSEM